MKTELKMESVTEENFHLFSLKDPANTGRPFYWDPVIYLAAVEQMIMADELVTALEMLDKVPAWYRDNPLPEFEEMRAKLYAQIATTFDYANDNNEMAEKLLPVDSLFYAPRLQVMKMLVEKLGPVNIIECGPANFWLPQKLKEITEHAFGYKGFTINKTELGVVMNQFWPEIPLAKDVFTCLEVIEHLWNPDDLIHMQRRHAPNAKAIVISTPKYTLGGGLPDWDTRPLGHVRTFTPKELLLFCQKHWGNHAWDWAYAEHGGFMVAYGVAKGLELKQA